MRTRLFSSNLNEQLVENHGINSYWLALSYSASIMAGGSHMQSGFNSIKLENPGYYCNSYTPPGAPDHHAMLASSGYSKFIFRFRFICSNNHVSSLMVKPW